MEITEKDSELLQSAVITHLTGIDESIRRLENLASDASWGKDAYLREIKWLEGKRRQYEDMYYRLWPLEEG